MNLRPLLLLCRNPFGGSYRTEKVIFSKKRNDTLGRIRIARLPKRNNRLCFGKLQSDRSPFQKGFLVVHVNLCGSEWFRLRYNSYLYKRYRKDASGIHDRKVGVPAKKCLFEFEKCNFLKNEPVLYRSEGSGTL